MKPRMPSIQIPLNMFQNLENLSSQFPATTPRPADAPVALDGIRVLDFGQFVAGPYAAMMLADLGANVIKIEAPQGGDPFRNYPPTDDRSPGRGASFYAQNRNKRSIVVDLKSPAGREVVYELISNCDVLVENFSTGVMARFGLSYEECRTRNPRLVYCSISAYGRDGALAHRIGFDPVVQAESGFMDMNGFPDREGVRTSAAIMDISAALFASNAILAALVARTSTGQGQYCEVALFDCAVPMMGYAPLKYLFTGEEPQRMGNRNPDSAPSDVFRCQDGLFYLSTGNTAIFQRMCEAVEMPGLMTDPRFQSHASRLANGNAIAEILQLKFLTKPWAYWSERFWTHGVPAGEVRSMGKALRSAEAQARELVTVIPDAEAGWVPNLKAPTKLSHTPVVTPQPAPKLGAHTEAILAEVLGYDGDKIEAARSRGAFGAYS